MEISAEVVLKTGGRRTIETQLVKMSAENPGIYALKIDLRSQLGMLSLLTEQLDIHPIKFRWGRHK
jgi:hypothetical protein